MMERLSAKEMPPQPMKQPPDDVRQHVIDWQGHVTARLPPEVEGRLDASVEGRIGKYYEEVCLYEQPFVKENTVSIDQLIKTKIAKLGENITVARFARFKVGDTAPAE